MGILKTIKDNYNYFKAGRREEFDQENAATRKRNMQRLKGEDVQDYHETRGKGFWETITGRK